MGDNDDETVIDGTKVDRTSETEGCVVLEFWADIEALADTWEQCILGYDPFLYNCTHFIIHGWGEIKASTNNGIKEWVVIVEPTMSLEDTYEWYNAETELEFEENIMMTPDKVSMN